MSNNTVYIISGPAGVGKSTTSSALVRSLKKSAYISGDDISHIPVNGRGKPWLCRETLHLTWDNIRSVALNLLNYGYDVVIDYVAFPSEVERLAKQLVEKFDPVIRYVVLLADEDTLLHRDQRRPEDHRMGDRCAVLLKEFQEYDISERYLLDTWRLDDTAIEGVVKEIKEDPRFEYRVEM